jgi:predicted RND superfamily exporter protein
MIFLGYMVISSVQLGATIDYAILMTNYYLEGRKTLGKKEAGEYAAEKAGMSIVMSSLVLSSAGFVVSFTFTQEALSQLGILIGRGALLSGFFAIFILPQVLILLDKLILKTSFNSLFRRKQNEI